MDSSNVCNSLIAWLETFPNVSGVTVAGLADGVVMSRVLNMIDSGHFSAAWQARLKVDCGDNWRLKVSNLRKIQQSVVDYLQNLNVQYAVNTLPDLARIGEHADPEEVARMLQLILGCAINCPHKESYIGTIMSMDPEVQAVVMTTVQTVFMRDASPGAEVAPGPASFHPNQRTIAEQLEATTRARDEAVTRVLELEMQVAEAAEKREQLAAENTRLVERLEGLEGEAVGGTVSRYKDLKKKIDSLQDALFKLETSRDEYRGRVDVLEQERAEILQRCEELQKLADQAHTLQDEVDVLRDMGQRATQAETTIESYKKKLDELSDLRRQNKILENKNSEYMQHILELEEDVKKNDTWRPQLELFKKQVSELRQQLDDETKKADRLAFDCKKLTEKVEAITIEKDRVVQERDDLKEHVEELRCLNSTQSPSRRAGGPHSDLLASDQEELWERLVRLRHENEQLKKAGNSAAGSGDPVLQAMLADLQERHDSVSTENRKLNQRIMELESEVEESRGATGGSTPTPSSASTISASPSPWTDASKRDLEKRLQLKCDEVSTLKDTIVKKDGEMAAMEERYKKYLTKAKSVIKTLDPKFNPSLVPDVSALRQQLYDKDKYIESLKRESDKAKDMRDMEEKLITSAFYNFGMNMHRQMINQRLAAVETGQHSYLSKARTATSSQRRGNVGNRGSASGSGLDESRFC